MKRYEELSKEVSYVLRYAPWKYELEMDEINTVYESDGLWYGSND